MTPWPTLFDTSPLPTTPQPELSRGQKLTARNRELLDAGVHPATRARVLDPAWGFACVDCAHAVRITNGNRSWWKCRLHRLGTSASEHSDIRVSWPACTRLRIDQATA